MESQSFSEDIRRYISLAWHWAWLLILAGAIAAGVAYYINRNTTPVYQASATFLINEAPLTRSADYSSIVTSQSLAQTYALLMTKEPVLQGVVDRLGLNLPARYLAGSISVQPVKDTQLIVVSVVDTNPQRAVDIANTLGEVFSEQNQGLQASRYTASKQNLENQLARLDQQIQEVTMSLSNLGEEPVAGSPTQDPNRVERDRLQTTLAQYRQTYAYLLQSYEQVRLAEAQSTSNIVQVESAQLPRSPIRPRTMRNSAMAGALGLMVAAGIVFLIEALDDTIKSPEDITRQLGVPILGIIATHESETEGPVTANQPRTPVAEAFRALRTNIQYASVDRPLNTILVTSPSPEDGKSTIAANLGVVLAQGGRKVVVVDADLRRPRVHKLFKLSNQQGTSDLFVKPPEPLNGTIQKTEVANLYALTSGNLPPNPSELLGSEKMVKILDMVHDEADIIIIDSPPLLAVTDAAVLAPRTDGVLLVVKPGKTKLAACRQAVEQLQRVGANILGVVLNDVELRRSRYKYAYYKGYYSYHNYYGDKDKKKKIVESVTKE